MPQDLIAPIRAHLDGLLEHAPIRTGPDPCALWFSALDLRTKRYPEDAARPESIGKRVYRYIDAPHGSSLYWDQPQVAACHALSARLGEPKYAEAADACVRDFLKRCVSHTGVYLWGNHFYWDARLGRAMFFKGDDVPHPVDPAAETGAYHECRPLPPAWGSFWRVDAEGCARAVREATARHVFDPQSGGFNRHADRKRVHAFIEAGGIVAESAAWLYARTREPELLERALRVARFSFDSRNPSTGLLENDRTSKRWDKLVCTTEVGLWAGSILRAGEYTGEAAFAETAGEAVRAFLHYGFDEKAGKYYGKLNVADGAPSLGPKTTEYQPGDHADLWAPLFPAHDYPLALGETCVRLYERTGDAVFAAAVRRLAAQMARERPARGGRGAYAEHYGRGIWFLKHAGDVLREPAFDEQARALAAEALETLFAHGMFRGHPGEERYDAVDGVGLLLLALLYLQDGAPPDGMGFGF
ncbi:MAG: hypothetical protein M5U26_05290 [Planctomycetota bacterium]|nr:hypothetical protein [Planctomycetota bacterium]